jgi:hypothetical protein
MIPDTEYTAVQLPEDCYVEVKLMPTVPNRESQTVDVIADE